MKQDESGGWHRENGDILGVGSTRRLRALVATGYTAGHLVEHVATMGAESCLDLDKRVDDILEARLYWVSASDHEAIRATFERLQMTPGPSPAARAEAKRRRWPVPFELDEDRIDDPEYAPRRARRKDAFA